MFKKIAVTAVAVTITAGAVLTTQTETAKADAWGAAAGGFVAGAIVGSVLSQPRYQAPRRVYRPAPRVTYYRAQPWTPAWYQYCSRKYRSFNPNTGYYLAYSGQYRFCN